MKHSFRTFQERNKHMLSDQPQLAAVNILGNGRRSSPRVPCAMNGAPRFLRAGEVLTADGRGDVAWCISVSAERHSITPARVSSAEEVCSGSNRSASWRLRHHEKGQTNLTVKRVPMACGFGRKRCGRIKFSIEPVQPGNLASKLLRQGWQGRLPDCHRAREKPPWER